MRKQGCLAASFSIHHVANMDIIAPNVLAPLPALIEFNHD
jgi:hypothetical protein